jgi:hypothetical protein
LRTVRTAIDDPGAYTKSFDMHSRPKCLSWKILGFFRGVKIDITRISWLPQRQHLPSEDDQRGVDQGQGSSDRSALETVQTLSPFQRRADMIPEGDPDGAVAAYARRAWCVNNNYSFADSCLWGEPSGGSPVLLSLSREGCS